jgi:(1->4)-alpha-D-glucan 1-alpha-D-glucosylmutase
LRFQQLSGPVMAKGSEDTAFYNYNRLISLNEVGGDPSRFGASVSGFHAFCLETARRSPLTMLTTATHDTKRGEDARLRIDALSRVPRAWADAVTRWSALNQPQRTGDMPDRNAEYLFYQTLVGAWPIDPARAWDYMLKAAREAKAHTSWPQPNEAYEDALRRFVEGALANQPFVAELEAFIKQVTSKAAPATLAQTLLCLTAPGVPDIYQGTGLYDLSLVDPDNRRSVNYEERRMRLDIVEGLETAADVVALNDPELTKLWLTHRVLHTRRRHAAAFAGSYEPLDVDARGVVAFRRGAEVIALAATHLPLAGEATATLPDGAWRNVLRGATHDPGPCSLAQLLGELNVALLVMEDDS